MRFLHRIAYGHWPEVQNHYAMGGAITRTCRVCRRFLW